jgi:hypothetical protein
MYAPQLIIAWMPGTGPEFIVIAFYGVILGARVIWGIVRWINDRDDPGYAARLVRDRAERRRRNRRIPSLSYQVGRVIGRLVTGP